MSADAMVKMHLATMMSSDINLRIYYYILQVRDEDEVRESLADVEELDEEIGGESRIDIIKQKFKRKGTKSEFGEVSDTKYGMKSELRCESKYSYFYQYRRICANYTRNIKAYIPQSQYRLLSH